MQPNKNQLDSYLQSEYQGLVDLLSSGYPLNLSQKNRLSALADQLGKPNPLLTVAEDVLPTAPTEVKKGLFSNPMLEGAWSLFKFVASVGITVLILNSFIFRPYQVDGMSMSPTLTNRDRLIIVKVGKTWADITRSDYLPKRGSIVVIRTHIHSNAQFIKRVVGLPGERVVVKDGKITVYNQKNPNGFNPDDGTGWGPNLEPAFGNVDVTVPSGEIFVVGDNRKAGGSLDSRSELGTVSEKDIVGVAKVRLMPVNKARLF